MFKHIQLYIMAINLSKFSTKHKLSIIKLCETIYTNITQL